MPDEKIEEAEKLVDTAKDVEKVDKKLHKK